MATQNSGNPSFTSASLYIGDLPNDVTEALLFEIFNAVGPVASIRVCRDAVTRRSLGYAYVNFHNVVDAERALDTMNFTNIRGTPCRIMWSQRDPALRKSGNGNIFVKNLDKSIDNKTLFDTFSMFGNILSCKVATNDKSESRGYGFVHYETDEAAAKAIEKVNGMVIAGKKVYVAAFKPKAQRGADQNTYTNLYVKNLPTDMTKERFEEMFQEHGKVTSSMLATDEEGKAKGFGFINYESNEEAVKAVESLNDTELDGMEEGKKLFVGRAQKKSERQKELTDKFEKLKVERQKKYQGVNLYIKNLEDTVEDEQLKEEFAKFGAITSARIMKDSASGRSKGFGFVCFSTPEEATKATAEMNGAILNGKPLYVALAQRRDVRQAQLQQQRQKNVQQAGPMGAAPIGYGAPMMYGMPGQMPGRPMMYPGQPMMRGRPGQPMQPMYAQPGMMRPGQPMQPMYPGQQQGMVPVQQQQQQPRVQQSPQQQQRGNNRNPTRGGQAKPRQSPTPGADEPLNPAMLASVPPAQQKQMIGERLFPLIQNSDTLTTGSKQNVAGKVTGMLLEMDNGELLHLLESKDALELKVTEACQVLEANNIKADASA